MAFSVILSIDLIQITFLELKFSFTYLSLRFLNNVLHLSVSTFKQWNNLKVVLLLFKTYFCSKTLNKIKILTLAYK